MLEQPRSWIQKDYKSFNGLRGLAVLMVFVNHYGSLFLPNVVAKSLWPGVDLFFVLSGFLITGILYDSRMGERYFRTFYIRRALRILPLYYGFFFALRLLKIPLHLQYQPSFFWSHLLYISNLIRNNPEVSNPTVFNFIVYRHVFGVTLGALWSLCVEEQFYLIWPIFVWAIPSRRALMWCSSLGVLATLALRTGLYFHDPVLVARYHFLYFVTYTRCDGLLIGAWLALWLRATKISPSRLQGIARILLLSAGGVLVVGQVTIGRRWPFDDVNPLLCTYGYTLIGLFAAGILLLALDDSSLVATAFRNPFLRGLGVVSYGFYFFHALPLLLVRSLAVRHVTLGHHGFLVSAVVFMLIYASAWISFRFYESPFLVLKQRLAPGHRSVPSGCETPTFEAV